MTAMPRFVVPPACAHVADAPEGHRVCTVQPDVLGRNVVDRRAMQRRDRTEGRCSRVLADQAGARRSSAHRGAQPPGLHHPAAGGDDRRPGVA
jgi:hypothetical protein